MVAPYRPPRLLIIPGLRDSGSAHWQTWLQQQYRDARRVVQRDFSNPDLQRWADPHSQHAGQRRQRRMDRGGAQLRLPGPGTPSARAPRFTDSPGPAGGTRRARQIRPGRAAAPSAPGPAQHPGGQPERSVDECRQRTALGQPLGLDLHQSGGRGPHQHRVGLRPFPLRQALGSSPPRPGPRATHRPEHAAFGEWSFAI